MSLPGLTMSRTTTTATQRPSAADQVRSADLQDVSWPEAAGLGLELTGQRSTWQLAWQAQQRALGHLRISGGQTGTAYEEGFQRAPQAVNVRQGLYGKGPLAHVFGPLDAARAATGPPGPAPAIPGSAAANDASETPPAVTTRPDAQERDPAPAANHGISKQLPGIAAPHSPAGGAAPQTVDPAAAANGASMAGFTAGRSRATVLQPATAMTAAARMAAHVAGPRGVEGVARTPGNEPTLGWRPQQGAPGQRRPVTAPEHSTPLSRQVEARTLDDVVRVIRANLGQRRSLIKLRLNPPELGQLTVDLRMQDGAARIRIEAEQGTVRDLFRGSAGALATALAEQGISVERFEAVLADRPADQLFEGGSDGGQESASTQPSGRESREKTGEHADAQAEAQEPPDESADAESGTVSEGRIDVTA